MKRKNGKEIQPRVVYASMEFLYRMLPEPYRRANSRGGLGILGNCFWGGFNRAGMDAVSCAPLYYRPWDDQRTKLNLYELLKTPLMDICVRFDGRNYVFPVWDMEQALCGARPQGHVPLYGFGMPNVDDMPVLFTDHSWSRYRQQVCFAYAIEKFLKQIGYRPNIFWLNEAHTIPLMARIRHDKDPFFKGAKLLFTIHTLQKAGMQRYYDQRFEQMELPGEDWESIFVRHNVLDFTFAAMCLADRVNGVSERHAQILRDDLFPEFEGKITHVTNGTDAEYWMNPVLWRMVSEGRAVSGLDILSARLEKKREESARVLQNHPGKQLDPSTFWIGFVRRLADYKNLWNMLAPILSALCADKGTTAQTPLGELPGRGMVFYMAARAPENDGTCNWWMQEFSGLAAQHEGMQRRCIISHEYNLEHLRRAAQILDGNVEVPRPGEEACGTSGPRIAVNGGIQFSSTLFGEEAIVDAEKNPAEGNGYFLGAHEYNPLALYRKLCHAQDLHDTAVKGGCSTGPYFRLLENTFNLGRECDIIPTMDGYRKIFENMLMV